MKLLLCLFALATVLNLAAADSPPPAPPAAIGLAVQLLQTRTSQNTPWVSTWGSYEKNYTAQRAIRVNLKLFGNFDPNVTVRWGFVAQKIGGGLFVYSKGERETEIQRRRPDIEIISEVLHGSDLNLKAINQRNTAGGRPYGYVVIVSQGGRVLASKESSKGLIALLDQP